MTDQSAHVSAPPAAPVDVALPKLSFLWTRLFCWLLTADLTGALVLAILIRQPAFAWPIAALLALVVMFYVGGARATDIVQLVQSSGIIRAAQATATAVATAAASVTNVVNQIAPAAVNATPRVAGDD